HTHHTNYSSHNAAHHRDIHSFPTRRSSDLELQAQLEAERTRYDQDRASWEAEQDLLLRDRQALEAEWRRLEARAEQAYNTFEERSEEHTSELQSHLNLVCRLLLEKKKIHHIQALLNHVEIADALKHLRAGNLFRVGIIDAVHARGLKDHLRFDLHGAHNPGVVGVR